MRYKAFISYRHSENGRRHAVALETALKRYAKPTLARPMPIFRDEKHMKPDISLPKLIQDGLENSEYLIFLAERASAESQWCGKELEYWCNPNLLNRRQNLIIVLIGDEIALSGTNGIDWSRTTALPSLLQPYLDSIPLYLDLFWAKTDAEADLQNPRYKQAIKPLAARLRGVNPEDFDDIEIRNFRKNIRLRNGAIGVLLTMLLVSLGATFWALDAQKRAEASALEAQTQLAITRIATSHKLPDNLDVLASLDSLNCASWGLGSVPKDIGKLERMKFLDLSNNQLQTLPNELFALKNLESLNLYYNQLSSLPEGVFKLKKLTHLNISYNKFATVPKSIGLLTNLTYLCLNYSGLKELPTEIFDLKNLQTLELAGQHRLEKLPWQIGNLQNLERLNLDGFAKKDLPVEIWKLTKLKSLDLTACQLEQLPDDIGNLKNLEALCLKRSAIKSLPEGIKKLQTLKSLDLSGTQLNNFPGEFAKLQYLPLLDTLKITPYSISNGYYINPVDWVNKMSPGIGQLKNLKYLDLRNAQKINSRFWFTFRAKV